MPLPPLLSTIVLCVLMSHVNGQVDSRDRGPPASKPGVNNGVTATAGGAKISNSKTSIEENSIEEQLILLSNVTKASELLSKLGASLGEGAGGEEGVVGGGGAGGGGGGGGEDGEESTARRRQRPPRQSFTDQASCEPEMHTIDLSNYTYSAEDNNEVVIFPRCIRVTRCGGCCGPSNLLSCLPTRRSMVEVTRALVKLTPLKGSRRDTTTLETIQVEQHDACSCQCREKESDCDPVKHRYSPEKCKCICVDVTAQAACSHPEKWWDPRNCACKCRAILHCSTGLTFSHETCTCEVSIA